MEPILYGKNNIPIDSQLVGNKAFNLFKIMNDVAVPGFIVLGASEFLKVLSFEENREINYKLRTLWLNKLSLASYLGSIQSMILKLSIPKEWKDSLKRNLDASKIYANYSVRSSSVYEDSEKQSAPGVFTTVLNVEDKDLMNAVKQCWASNFTLQSTCYFGNELHAFDDIKMGVIIQSMIKGKTSGILFTVNPVNYADEMIVEMTYGEGDKLTDGDEVGKKIVISNEESTDSHSDFIKNLVQVAKKIKYIYGIELDIEWVYNNSCLYILQVRPISTVSSKKNFKHQIYSISEIDKMDATNSGLEKKIKRWCEKKRRFNLACDKERIRRLKWYFVQNFDQSLYKNLEDIISKINGDYVSIALNDTLSDIVVKKDEILSKVIQYSKINEMNNIISIKEIPVNLISLISNIGKDNAVYIEVIDGIMKGLKTGELKSSKYELDFNNAITYKKEIHNKLCYQIQFPDGEITLVENHITKYKNITDYLVKIANYSRKLAKRGQIGAIEWWICDNELYATDISLNESILNSMEDESQSYYVSQGDIEGYAVFLNEDDIDVLGKIAYGNAISVDCIDDSVNRLGIYKELRKKLSDMKEKGNVILCVKRPIIGIAPILDLVDGVVFEEASILCHLSVMLREKGIPAISVMKQFHNIKNGEFIVIDS